MNQADGIVGEFFALREESGADLLAMQVGDFYEFFGDDARTVNEELDLKLSQKSAGGQQYAMAGVPVDDLTPYLTALVERGYRVAVADQQEAESGHRREVSRVVSPGTLLAGTDGNARYIAAVVSSNGYGLALADVTTGQFFVTELADDRAAVISELYRFDPVEILPGPTVRSDDTLLSRFREELSATVTPYDTAAFEPGASRHTLREQFGEGTLESIDLSASGPGSQAAGAIIQYVEETGSGVLASFTRLQELRDADHVALDATTQRNLELTETMQGDDAGSLLSTIDHTVTSGGHRQLREWLVRPRRDRQQLDRRLDSVDALSRAALARDRLTDELQETYDLARLASKASHGSAGPGDLDRLRATLHAVPRIESIITETTALADTPLADRLATLDRQRLAELRQTLDAAVEDDPSTTVGDGVIAPGYDDQLDEIVEEYERHQSWLSSLADRVKQQHGLTHVTVDRNKTDGYYIQVGRSEADDVPDTFRHIKSLKNSKRFVTDELEERERAILRLEEQRQQREQELFVELQSMVAEAADLLQRTGTVLATVDVLASLATHAAEQGWTRPTLGPEGSPIDIDRGRHPVVETTTEFVPNDLTLADDRRFLIVTGPNMSGKSTYMRQTALIVLLAQIGSFVPAERAQIGLIDGIYTRVGALDELAQGRSTFMIEMQELSNILHSASENSLIILDEVGRGTATYDGISIAWSATEYIHNTVGAKTLFATHYHELTTLADHLTNVSNVHVAAEETNGDVTFLRTIREGPTDRSYGIHVAELAGIPDPVVSRAHDVLERLRNDEAIEAKGTSATTQVVFDLESGSFQEQNDSHDPSLTDRYGDNADQILSELTDVDLESTSPIELLSTVQRWQRQLSPDSEDA